MTNRQIERAMRFATPVLVSHFDNQKVQAILSAMKINYQTLDTEVPSFKSPFNRMLFKLGLDLLVFYRAILTELPQPQALLLMQPFVDNWMDGQFDRWFVRAVYANRTLHLLYRRWWFANTNRADELDGQKFEFLPPSGDLFYGVNVIRCGIVKFLARMGAPEIAPFICRGDFHIQKYVPKGIVFKRSGVIAEGAAYCDFRYYVAAHSQGIKEVS